MRRIGGTIVESLCVFTLISCELYVYCRDVGDTDLLM